MTKNKELIETIQKLNLVHLNDEVVIEILIKTIAANIADFCCDIDGGDNMFSRSIRREYEVE